MKSLPLVSICIPTFNGERFIRQTINSALTQDYPALEILVCDHSSSDSTLEILRSFQDERIRITINPTGGGAESNWNKAICDARGKYVKLLCQDDILMPNCISEQVNALEHNVLSSFCFSPRDILTPRGRRILKSRGHIPNSSIIYLRDNISQLVRSGTNIFGEPCAVLIRSKALRDAPPFRGSYLIDLKMWVALWEIGPAVSVQKTLSQFRISNGSWTSALTSEQSLQIEEFFQQLKQDHPDLISDNDLETGFQKARWLQKYRRLITQTVEILHL